MLSRYFGSEFTKFRLCTDSVVQSIPIITKAIATTLSTAKTGWSPHRSSRDTAGASRKLIRIARTIGSKNSFAQEKAQRITTRYANPISLPKSNDLLDSNFSGIELWVGIWTHFRVEQFISPFCLELERGGLLYIEQNPV